MSIASGSLLSQVGGCHYHKVIIWVCGFDTLAKTCGGRRMPTMCPDESVRLPICGKKPTALLLERKDEGTDCLERTKPSMSGILSFGRYAARRI